MSVSFGSDLPGAAEKAAFEKLSLRIKTEKIGSKGCEKLGYTDESGGKINLSDGRTMSFRNEYEGRRYELEFRNNAAVDLADLEIKCRFFYIVESKWRAKTNRTEEEIKHKDCSFSVCAKAGSKLRLFTEPFVMQSWAAPSGVYMNNGNAEVVEAEPDGLWVKVRCKTPVGQTLTRDFCEPKSLASRLQWN